MNGRPAILARLPACAQVASLAVLAGMLGSCGGDGDDSPSLRAAGRYDGSGRLLEGSIAKTAKPNVVLICLDTVREDSIRAHGDEPAAMPALAAFCERSTHFVDASGPASWTGPCVTSLLTGLRPMNHGVKGPMLAWPLVGSVATLAEYLKSAGYRTAAFTGGGWVSEEMGLGQGFDSFRSPFSFGDPGGHLDRWLKTLDGSKPFFLFLHTYEAHDPYGAKYPPDGSSDPARVAAAVAYAEDLRAKLPKESGKEFPPGVDGRELLLRWRSDPLTAQALSTRIGRERLSGIVINYTFMMHPIDPLHAEVEAKLRTRYRHGLELTDADFAKSLANLEDRLGNAPTVFIVVTDHGESFGENRVLGHGRWLTDVLTRVVLAIRAPGRLPRGDVHGSCSLVDVVPTVLDLCGMPVPTPLDGQSLVAQARGTAGGRPIEAEEYRTVLENGDWIVLRTASVRTQRAKYVGTRNPSATSNEEQLFDLIADPAEDHPGPVVDLERFGADFVEAVARARTRLDAMAKETIASGKPR